MYRCEAATVAGFVQQVAVAYVARGYWFYVTGRIPSGKDPCSVDAKLIERYGVDRSRAARSRRKLAGVANVHYIRHGRFFVLLATHGEHHFFEEERFRDIRREPLQFAGYSISYRSSTVTGRWHPSVRIERGAYLALKAALLDIATRRSVESLGARFRQIPFEPWAPVRRQVLCILRAVNRERAAAGLEEVPSTWVRLRRRPVRVFEPAAPRAALGGGGA